MPLVDYSDSEEEDNNKSRASLKRKRGVAEDLPPLPAAFHDLYATAARGSTQDDPSLHAGRKRQVPHVEGNWATHVYLEWYPTSTESSSISGLVDLISERSAATNSNADAEKSTIHPLHLTPLSTPAPLHISLSAPLILQTHQREDFHNAMEASLRRAKVKTFDVKLETPKWVSNQDQSRWFLVAGIRKPAHNELNRLLLASNKIAQSWEMARLYEGDRVTTVTAREAAKKKTKRRSSDEFAPEGDQSGCSASWVTEGTGTTRLTKTEDDVPDRSHCFHISLGWRLNAPDGGLQDIMADAKVAKFVEMEMKNITVRFESVKLKIGNQIHAIPLEGQREEGKGILG